MIIQTLIVVFSSVTCGIGVANCIAKYVDAGKIFASLSRAGFAYIFCLLIEKLT